MTYRDFQRYGFELSEAEFKAFERKIDAAYRDAYKDISAKIKVQYLKLSGVSPENRYNELLKYNRLNELLKQIETDYLKYSSQAGKEMLTGLRVAMSNNYYRQQFALAWSATPAKFAVLPNEIIDVAVLGTEESVKKITKAMAKPFSGAVDYMPQAGSLKALLADNAKKEVAAVKRAVVNGLRNGQSYDKTATAVKNVIGYTYKDGKTVKVKGAKASAKRIARTESARVLNAAAYANSKQAESQGIETIREWDATLDLRTRARHQELDGKIADKDGLFRKDDDSAKYPGDWSTAGMNINCRCSVCEYTEGMRPDIRTGRNPVSGKSETFGYKDYPEWAKSNGLIQDKNGRWK